MNRAMAVHIIRGFLSRGSPQPVATFVAAVSTQEKDYLQLFEEIPPMRSSYVRAVANRASWRYMKCHSVLSP
jgi:hypothetical protein